VQQLGLSRSELYSTALQAYLSKYNRQQILSKLNDIYGEESSDLDLTIQQLIPSLFSILLDTVIN
jgi:metal-responsive CopG/Arc/MetJ family transcriptional regulator